MYRKSIYTKERVVELEMNEYFCGNRTVLESMENIKECTDLQGNTGENWGRAVARPACQDLPNFCRLRYPFRCSAYYVPLNSFSLLESIWLR